MYAHLQNIKLHSTGFIPVLMKMISSSPTSFFGIILLEYMKCTFEYITFIYMSLYKLTTGCAHSRTKLLAGLYDKKKE
jgi:hypothetical protein